MMNHLTKPATGVILREKPCLWSVRFTMVSVLLHLFIQETQNDIIQIDEYVDISTRRRLAKSDT